MDRRPRLRDNRGRGPFELYPIGQIPEHMILKMCRHITYKALVGSKDLTGDDWGDVFAAGIGGVHLESSLGIADVIYENQCWSAKTVTAGRPHTIRGVRIISGRCSPDYSYGITDPHEDIQRTGNAVLGIYNERINIAKDQYEPLRASILVRNFESFEFMFFEQDIHRYVPRDYEWRENKNGNLQGHDVGGIHRFTWQPHGSQFTVIYSVPASAIRFSIRKPPLLDFDRTLEQAGYNDDWVDIMY